jgi:hypothetical protein
MNAAAEAVMKELPDLVMAYGNSDEFRYVDMRPYKETGLPSCAATLECWEPKSKFGSTLIPQ